MNDIVEPGWLDTHTVTASIGISSRSFREWKVKPVGTVGRKNYYTIVDILAAQKARMARKLEAGFGREVAGAGKENASARRVAYELGRNRLIKERADAMELKNDLDRMKVAPIDFLTFLLSGFCHELRSTLDILPVECMHTLGMSKKDAEVIRGITDRLANSMRNLMDIEWVKEHVTEYNIEQGNQS